MKYLFLFLLSVSSLKGEPFGTYTNNAEGFYRESLVLSKEGRGYYWMMAGVPVLWSYDPKTKKIVIRGNLGANMKVEQRMFSYDEGSNCITSGGQPNPRDKVLVCVDKEVDGRIQNALDSFDWNFKAHELK